jgi:hypothetical protein
MEESSAGSRPHGITGNGKRISGSGHFALQVMRQSKDKLPNILEDHSNTFSVLYEEGGPKGQQADFSRRVAFQRGGEVPYTKKQHGSMYGDSKPCSKRSIDFDDVCSISTMGNGTHFDREVPSGNAGGDKDKTHVSVQSSAIQEKPWLIQQCPNEPHPLLEFPPLYWMVRGHPGVLAAIKDIYSYRWRMSYPLQRRVFLSQQLRKAGIFCTIGELLLVLPLVAIFVCGLLFAFVWPSTHWSGHIARLPLILALATAMRNSIITLLIGLPFERGRSKIVVLCAFACLLQFRLLEFLNLPTACVLCFPLLVD